MNKIIIAVLAVAVLGLGALVTVQKSSIGELEQKVAEEANKNSIDSLSNHQREVWLSVLEWCESQGIPSAVNPKDRDGTPSFGAFQFKPGTFKMYSEKYGLTGQLMDYGSQRAILGRMLDDKDVKWQNEFPGCTAKIGLPPVKF